MALLYAFLMTHYRFMVTPEIFTFFGAALLALRAAPGWSLVGFENAASVHVCADELARQPALPVFDSDERATALDPTAAGPVYSHALARPARRGRGGRVAAAARGGDGGWLSLGLLERDPVRARERLDLESGQDPGARAQAQARLGEIEARLPR